MTPREYCLARVLTEETCHGPVVVLKCRDAADDEARKSYAALIAHKQTIYPSGTNTREEAESAYLTLKGERDITVVTSAYHQLRAFLTFVAVFKAPTRIWNAPAPSDMDLLAGEMGKIAEYSKHVVTYRYGVHYFKWRDRQ